MSHGTWTYTGSAEHIADEWKHWLLPAVRPHLVAERSASNIASSLDEISLNEFSEPHQPLTTEMKVERNRLLELPAELRTRTYELILIDECPKGIRILNFCYCLEPALLRTCKQIRTEATAIFYGRNRFLAIKPHEALPWLQQIGAERRAMVREVHVLVWWQTWQGATMKGRSHESVLKAWLVLKHHEGNPEDEFLGQRKFNKKTFNALTNGAVLEEWWTYEADKNRKLLHTLPNSTTAVNHLSMKTRYKEIARFPVHRNAGRVEITYEVN